MVDVRVHLRATSLARMVAGVLELPAAAFSRVGVPEEPLSWEDILAPAQHGGPGWTDGLVDDPSAVTVHDLRWWPDARDRPATVLVLATLGTTLIEIRPTERGDRYQRRPRHPLEVWTALCRLTASVSERRPRHNSDASGPRW